jgi:hypothetical protein
MEDGNKNTKKDKIMPNLWNNLEGYTNKRCLRSNKSFVLILGVV